MLSIFCFSVDTGTKKEFVLKDEFNYEVSGTLCKVSTCSQSCPFAYKMSGTAVYSVGQVLHLGFDLNPEVRSPKIKDYSRNCSCSRVGVFNPVNASAGGHFNTCCCAGVCVPLLFSRSCFIN